MSNDKLFKITDFYHTMHQQIDWMGQEEEIDTCVKKINRMVPEIVMDVNKLISELEEVECETKHILLRLIVVRTTDLLQHCIASLNTAYLKNDTHRQETLEAFADAAESITGYLEASAALSRTRQLSTAKVKETLAG